MKNLMAANVQAKGRYSWINMKNLLCAQIQNSLEVGWKPEDIIIISNIGFSFSGVTTIKTEMNDFCLTGSKMFALKFAYDEGIVGDRVWAHDLDAWQNYWFDFPDIKDVGITTYSTSKFNGGSVFWKKSSIDIIDEIIYILKHENHPREEPTINRVLKSKKYKNRVTVLDTTYNIGCSGFLPRIWRASKPILVSHLNPRNKIAWETHRLDRNGMGLVSISARLEKLLREWFCLSYNLSKEGHSRAKELRCIHMDKIESGKYS